MGLTELAVKMNGKKLPLSILILGTAAVVTLQAQVVNIIEDVAELKPMITEQATTKQEVANLKETFEDFRTEQRIVNREATKDREEMSKTASSNKEEILKAIYALK